MTPLVYDVDTGSYVGGIALTTNGVTYSTKNTPAVSTFFGDTRIYITAENSDADVSRFYAVRLTGQQGAPFQILWSENTSQAGGQASPTVRDDRIVFDTVMNGTPTLVGVQDGGASMASRWNRSSLTGSSFYSSVALDPRGPYFYTWEIESRFVYRRRVDNGQLVSGSVNVDQYFSAAEGVQRPNSPMVIGDGPSGPAMIVSTAKTGGSYHVIAFDLATQSLLWRQQISTSFLQNSTAAQFPVVFADDGSPTVVAGTWNAGPMFIGTAGCAPWSGSTTSRARAD